MYFCLAAPGFNYGDIHPKMDKNKLECLKGYLDQAQEREGAVQLSVLH